MHRKVVAAARPLVCAAVSLVVAHGPVLGTEHSESLVTPSAQYSRVLTEAHALRLALGEVSFNQVLEGRIGLAESDAIEAGLRPNPELEVEWESADGLGDPSETTIRISQTFDTSGRRRLREQGAESMLEATRLEAQSSRVQRASEVRKLFYGTLHARLRGAVLADWDVRIGETERVVRRRVEVGDASAYDLRRLEHERALAQTQGAESDARLAEKREALLAMLGPKGLEFERVVGRLLPPAPPALNTLEARLVQRPDLRALGQKEQSARFAMRAGERGGIPDITLGMGTKRVVDRDREDWELVLGMSVPLLLFDHGQAATGRAAAQSRVVSGEYQLALREAQGAVLGSWQKSEKLQQSAALVEARYLPQARSLADTAHAAYLGGEIGILELLDAYRGVMETQLRALALALEARLARIELDSVAGGQGE